MRDEPSYHITANRSSGNMVLIVRHALPPHDIVERVEFSSRAKMREVGEALIETADAQDAVDRAISR